MLGPLSVQRSIILSKLLFPVVTGRGLAVKVNGLHPCKIDEKDREKFSGKIINNINF
jgi:hypothetical protein